MTRLQEASIGALVPGSLRQQDVQAARRLLLHYADNNVCMCVDNESSVSIRVVWC